VRRSALPHLLSSGKRRRPLRPASPGGAEPGSDSPLGDAAAAARRRRAAAWSTGPSRELCVQAGNRSRVRSGPAPAPGDQRVSLAAPRVKAETGKRQIEDQRFLPQTVAYTGNEKPGTIIINTSERHLYYVMGDGQARRYGVGVGKEGHAWSGTEKITRKAEWPDWRPPAEMIKRVREKEGRILPVHMEGRPGKPAGRAGALSRLDALPDSRHQPALDHRQGRFVGLHPDAQRGRHRTVRARQGWRQGYRDVISRSLLCSHYNGSNRPGHAPPAPGSCFGSFTRPRYDFALATTVDPHKINGTFCDQGRKHANEGKRAMTLTRLFTTICHTDRGRQRADACSFSHQGACRASTHAHGPPRRGSSIQRMAFSGGLEVSTIEEAQAGVHAQEGPAQVTNEKPGTIIVDTSTKYLYYVEGQQPRDPLWRRCRPRGLRLVGNREGWDARPNGRTGAHRPP
jgi:lipoprotein-anchoring transpeptidase ErfK/SrfK